MELTIDTASVMASLAISQEGKTLAEMSWECPRAHTVKLLPTIHLLLAHLGVTLQEMKAIFVCIGPGAYMGLRVGIATAQGIAYALGVPTVGIGRLEAEAYPHWQCGRPVVAIHQTGRGQVAWAAYSPGGASIVPPRLSPWEEMLALAPPGALFCGEITPEAAQEIQTRGGIAVLGAPGQRRASYLAEIGYRRLQEGHSLPPHQLRPLYLREAV